MAGGIQTDDDNLSDEQVLFILNYYRSRLMKNDQEKGRFNNDLYIQNLGCNVQLIQADKNEGCAVEDCILRTELQIPKPLETFKGINISFVGTPNGKPFMKNSHNGMFYKRAAKWTGKEPSWYYQNGYIYVVDPPTTMFTEMNIQGIFEDPQAAEKFRTCACPSEEEDCFDGFDFEYPLPQHHVDTVVKLIAETELRILTSIPVDNTNNSINQLTELLNAGNK